MSTPRERILVADDDPDARSLIKILLDGPEFEVLEAADGIEAVEKFEKFAPSLAVLDLMMPGRDGAEACALIKQRQKSGFVPVLMLTACDTVPDKVRLLQIGADDYLTKPFHAPELEARVRGMLRIRALTLQLQQRTEELMSAQQKLLEQQRQLVAHQLAGTAAHQLGQPLSAIMLSAHVIEKLPADDARFKMAVATIKSEAERMADLIEGLKGVDPEKTEEYFKNLSILKTK